MPTSANNGSLWVIVVTKALICVMLVVTVCYCAVMQIPLEGLLEKLILGVIGVYFGISAFLYQQHIRNSH